MRTKSRAGRLGRPAYQTLKLFPDSELRRATALRRDRWLSRGRRGWRYGRACYRAARGSGWRLDGRLDQLEDLPTVGGRRLGRADVVETQRQNGVGGEAEPLTDPDGGLVLKDLHPRPGAGGLDVDDEAAPKPGRRAVVPVFGVPVVIAGGFVQKEVVSPQIRGDRDVPRDEMVHPPIEQDLLVLGKEPVQ